MSFTPWCAVNPIHGLRPALARRGRPSAALVAGAAVFLAAAAGAAWAATGAGRDTGPRLHLDEVSSRVLPDSFELAGASVSADGGVVLWAANQPYLLVGDGAGERALRSEAVARPVAAALVEGDSLVEVVDAERRALLRLTLAGRVVAERALEFPWRVESAVRSGGGWVMAGRDVAGNYRVTRVSPAGARTPLFVLPARDYPSTRLAMRLSGAGDSVLAALVGNPYAVAVVGGRGRVVSDSVFAVPSLPKPFGRAEPLWMSMAIHPLDRGFIRTLSDLRSDRRALVTYDAAGRVSRRSLVAVPIAVVATVPERRTLLAARRTDRMELVTYRWRWADASD